MIHSKCAAAMAVKVSFFWYYDVPEQSVQRRQRLRKKKASDHVNAKVAIITGTVTI